MIPYLIEKGLEAFRADRDEGSLLRLLYLECRSNLTVLDAVVEDIRDGGGSLPDGTEMALADCLSVDVLGSVFLAGVASDGALKRLGGIEVSPAEEEADKKVSDSLASLLVRSQAVMRLAKLRSAGLAGRVNLSIRLTNLRTDYLRVVKALGPEVWKA